MAETNGLLNRRRGITPTEGSNPSVSAIYLLQTAPKVVRWCVSPLTVAILDGQKMSPVFSCAQRVGGIRGGTGTENGGIAASASRFAPVPDSRSVERRSPKAAIQSGRARLQSFAPAYFVLKLVFVSAATEYRRHPLRG